MKMKFMAIFAAFTLVFAFSMSAGAQTMLTDDVAFLKLGYSNFTAKANELSVDGHGVLDPDPDNLEGDGFNVQGEYNMNLGSVLLGFGLEYTYMTAEIGNDAEFVFHYLSPMVSAKFITAGGFYLGAGLSGRYLAGQSSELDAEGPTDPDEIEFDSTIDLWVNGIVGFMTPIQEFVYLDVEARFGYNLTNNQLSEMKMTSLSGDTGDGKLDIKSQYDWAIYVGVGYRVAATGF